MIQIPERFRYDPQLVNGDNVEERIHSLLPPQELFARFSSEPDPEAIRKRKEDFSPYYGSTRYYLTYSPLVGHNLISPVDHQIGNTYHGVSTGLHYARAVFEGGSIMPDLDESGRVVGARAILFHNRMRRMSERSLRALNYMIPVPFAQFAGDTLVYTASLGDEIYYDRNGQACRAYMRPYASPGTGAQGVTLKPEHRKDNGCIVFPWGFYFKNGLKIYQGEGARMVIYPDGQRLKRILGKLAGNYTEAGEIGGRARDAGFDETLMIGPYTYRQGARFGTKRDTILWRHDVGSKHLKDMMIDMVFSDGPGEELIFLLPDGRLAYLPHDVGRLGGTTLDYLVNHMAPRLGLDTVETPVTMRMITEGKVAGMAMIGNAAMVAPNNEVALADRDGNILESVSIGIPAPIKAVQHAWEAELSGHQSPSDSSLVTSIDLVGGRVAKEILDHYYANWWRDYPLN